MKRRKSIILMCCVIFFLLASGCSRDQEKTGLIEKTVPVMQECDIISALDIQTSDMKFSDAINSRIKKDWENWSLADEDARAQLGHMPGIITEYFENWDEAVKYIGFEPWNPFENIKWLEKMNYMATDVKDSITGFLNHCCCNVNGEKDGTIGFSSLTTGYTYNNLRIVFMDYISSKNFIDVSSEAYSLIKYYQLNKEENNIRVQENAGKVQGYNCVLGVQNFELAVTISLRFYKDDELKYEIRLTTLEDIDKLKEIFNKICSELSIPLEYAPDTFSDFTEK